VTGFLGNRSELYDSVNDEHELWTRFVMLWRNTCSVDAVSVKYLMTMLEGQEVLSELVGDKSGDSARKSLGRYIAFRVGKVYGGFKICKATMLDGTRRFKLSPSSGSEGIYSLNPPYARTRGDQETVDDSGPESASRMERSGIFDDKAPQSHLQVQNDSVFDAQSKTTSNEEEIL
jgi:hypothetical protein